MSVNEISLYLQLKYVIQRAVKSVERAFGGQLPEEQMIVRFSNITVSIVLDPIIFAILFGFPDIVSWLLARIDDRAKCN